MAPHPTLRPSQKEIYRRIVQAERNGSRAICQQLATGGGKTVIAGYISKQVADSLRGSRSIALYLVHRQELVEQVVGTLRDFGLGALTGRIQANHTMTSWLPLQVASIQTLVRRLDKVAWLQPRIVFIDECHHARAATWEKVLARFPKALKIGLTATPARYDGLGLHTHFDTLLVGPSFQELIAEHSLCPVETFELPPDIDLKSLSKSKGDYTRKSLGKMPTAPVLASAMKEIPRLIGERQTIHFARTRAHSRMFVEDCRSRGYTAEHVDGETPAPVRKKIMARFAGGATQFLSNVEIVTEGFDVPSCEAVIIARETLSVPLLLQMIGRVMRYQPGKIGRVLDLVGSCAQCNVYPGENIEWSLDDGLVRSKERSKANPKRCCEHCGYWFKRSHPECDMCGQAPTTPSPEIVEVELVKARQAEKRAAKLFKRNKTRRIIESMGDVEKLNEIARDYGHKPGWVNVQLSERLPWQTIWRRKREARAQ